MATCQCHLPSLLPSLLPFYSLPSSPFPPSFLPSPFLPLSHPFLPPLPSPPFCTHLVSSLLPPHGRKVLRRYQHPKQVVEGLGVQEDLQTPGVEAHGPQDVGQGSQHLSSNGNLGEGGEGERGGEEEGGEGVRGGREKSG